MEKKDYIEKFEKMGFGLFVHFGLFSVDGKGEWSKPIYNISDKKYAESARRFKPSVNWAKELVKTAEKAGCKYINITTRHHEGFSLYDTKGLSDYDAPHLLNGRDLIAEFTYECRNKGIIPFFYHTLLDWSRPEYKNDFPKYLDYLNASVEILCKNYGAIGGFWFDGMWDKPQANWEENRIYGTIRKFQPKAMIINNTGLYARGAVGGDEIDAVTYERGTPDFVKNSGKYRAGEMCQTMNDHWGYAKNDINYKSVKSLIEDFIDCRKTDCNFLLNVGPKGNGRLRENDKAVLDSIGLWIKSNKNFIYNVHSCNISAKGADVVADDKYYYCIIKDVPMAADENVQIKGLDRHIQINANIDKAFWLDNGKKVEINDGKIKIEPFNYGVSFTARVFAFTIK